jgi:hypothetical protein
MVTKSKVGKESDRSKVRIPKLNKETMRDLSIEEKKKIKGGFIMQDTIILTGGCPRPRS